MLRLSLVVLEKRSKVNDRMRRSKSVVDQDPALRYIMTRC